MTSRFKKPGANKHGITDTKLLKRLSAEKGKNRRKCEMCGKVIYDSMLQAHEAAGAYNKAFNLTDALNRKVAYECKESPGYFHYGKAVSDGALALLKSRGGEVTMEPVITFTPPPMPVVPEYVHKPVMSPVKIIQEAPTKDMDEINLNGTIYIKKHLVPPPPIIVGSVTLNGVCYNVIKK